MDRLKFKALKSFCAITLLAALAVPFAGCNFSGSAIEDILENSEEVEGEITIVTKEGKTVTLKIISENTSEHETTDEEPEHSDNTAIKKELTNVAELASILPSPESIEDVFRVLGDWEDAAELHEKGLTWTRIARELDYNEDKMQRHLEEVAEEKLHIAMEEGIITQEQAERKLAYFREPALKWVRKIFAETTVVQKEAVSTVDLASVLPSLESIEDVFRVLGVREDAVYLREEGLSWAHVARELDYHEDKMQLCLEDIAEEELHAALEDNLITSEQAEKKFAYFSELAWKRVKEIFADTVEDEKEPVDTVDAATFLPSLESIEDVFQMLDVWENAAELHEEGLSWAYVARELDYRPDRMHMALLDIAEESLIEAKHAGSITIGQVEEQLSLFERLVQEWIDEIFPDEV
jgi:orotate phosphoribosyltransferase-like protein